MFVCSISSAVIYYALLLTSLLSLFSSSYASELNAVKENETESVERSPSLFKAGEDWLALPEVFSNLDFTADNTPAPENDLAGQLKLRSTRFWGRVYIDGWPQTIQYFRAHFGIEPPMGRKTFVFAQPKDGCQDYENAHLLTSDHVVLVHRGSCTFGTKAGFAAKTNASALIIINNEPGIDHLPGPDAHTIQFSIASIAQLEGQLIEGVYEEGPSDDNAGLGRKLEGYLVPINCEKSGAKCLPATYEEQREVSNLVEGGKVMIYPGGQSDPASGTDFPIEYLLAQFGTKVMHESIKLPIVVAKPVDACTPLENDVKGKAVLVRRGSCPFVKKAEEIQAAGGRLMIVGNQHSYLVRMGVEPRWKGLNTAIPVVMVSKRAYSILVAESYSGGKISLLEDEGMEVDPEKHHGISKKKTINAETWEPVEKLHRGEGWPRSDLYAQKRYDELIEQHQDWPDRLAALKDAWQFRLKESKNPTTNATSEENTVKSEL